MKTYTFKHTHFNDSIQVGEPVEIDNKIIVVINILEVDFITSTVLFCGFEQKGEKND